MLLLKVNRHCLVESTHSKLPWLSWRAVTCLPAVIQSHSIKGTHYQFYRCNFQVWVKPTAYITLGGDCPKIWSRPAGLYVFIFSKVFEQFFSVPNISTFMMYILTDDRLDTTVSYLSHFWDIINFMFSLFMSRPALFPLVCFQNLLYCFRISGTY